jgi:hypothetical protein
MRIDHFPQAAMTFTATAFRVGKVLAQGSHRQHTFIQRLLDLTIIDDVTNTDIHAIRPPLRLNVNKQ